MSFEIEEVDTRSAPEELLREMHEYYLPLSAEMSPQDPPMSYERRAADWRRQRSDQLFPRWLLRVDDEIVASAVAWMNLEQNLENGGGWIYVRPDDRGNGHCRALAGVVFERLEEMGRRRFETYVREGHPAESLVSNAGLKPVYKEKRSRLVVAEIDMEMMRSWIERAEERAADYELRSLQAPFPADAVEKYCDLQFQMNTAPREDYESDDEVITPELWRETEAQSEATFHDLITYVAVHKPTGDFVGSTSIQIDQLQPERAWQWETVVHPDHRNKGLGRLLKAAMVERLVRDWPKVEHIDTFNAGSNEPMLNINIAMGFKPIELTNTYQGDLAAVRAGLGM